MSNLRPGLAPGWPDRLGTIVGYVSGMTNPSNENRDLLSWRFQNGKRQLTCGVSVRGAKAFDVITLPHWNVTAGAVEPFRNAAEAMRRHATIAASLRDAGWKLAAYSR